MATIEGVDSKLYRVTRQSEVTTQLLATTDNWFAASRIDSHVRLLIYDTIGLHRAGELLHNFVGARSCKICLFNVAGGDPRMTFGLGEVLGRLGRENVEVRISGLCGSAATLIPCWAGHVEASEDAWFLFHWPTASVASHSKDLGRVIEALDETEQAMIETYRSRIADPLGTILKDETLTMDVQGARGIGLVDAITP